LSFKKGLKTGDHPFDESIIDDLLSFHKKCLDIMDQDANAYAQIFETRKLSNNGRDADSNSTDIVQDAYKLSLKPPMELIETSIQLLDRLTMVKKAIPKSTTADLEVAVSLTYTCLTSSILIVESNLKEISESSLANDFYRQLDRYRAQGVHYHKEFFQGIFKMKRPDTGFFG
jgi:formiminotetrahydrofolate cyclodeaminase